MTTPHSTFPETPTLHARVQQTGWGDYEATLTLPGGHQQTLTGGELDDTRGQVINAAREYLHTHVGHPGRLRVEDPDGNWLLGVPPDDSDLVHLSETTAPAPAPPSVPPPRVTPLVLPARPSVTARRGGPSRSAGRRIAATGALILALLVVAGIAEAVHGSSPKPITHRAAATRRTTPTVSVATPAVTGSVSTSVTTPVAHHRPRPTPRHRSRRRPGHRPRHAAHAERHAAHAAAPAQTPTAHRAATHPSPSPHQAPAPAVLQPRSQAAPQPTPQPSPAPTPQPAPTPTPTPAPACYPGVLGC
jgi:hypothetical protein